ncbi:MAG TPA: class I SAM-dependent rRNA methyltransferase [Candidatus Hydrogenedens sp.]|nr:class I SAM-dependent rRNA methyltransferase [Candidatus Hydrogenedens sp.]
MNKAIHIVHIQENEERRLLRGHFWIFKDEVLTRDTYEDGDIIDVYDKKGRFICRGFVQSGGSIFARVLSFHQEKIDKDFFVKRLKMALELRQKLFKGSNAYRWVHAESDGLPGLIIDRYQSLVVVNSECKFYTRYENLLIEAINSFDGVKDIYFKSSETSPKDIPDEVHCNINNLQFVIPIKNAQKTGLFFDQRLNYIYSQKYMGGANVLDGFCYIGLWSCHAIQGGAKHVTGIDSSHEAITIARKNLELNGYSKLADFYDMEIEKYLDNSDEYDVIILDPPAYAKKKDFKKAFLKYQRLNSIAMQHIKKGGFLITCSCSHFISPSDFREIIKRSARNVSKKIRLLEFHGAAPDHPELLIMPELSYLKCAIFQVF